MNLYSGRWFRLHLEGKWHLHVRAAHRGHAHCRGDIRARPTFIEHLWSEDRPADNICKHCGQFDDERRVRREMRGLT